MTITITPDSTDVEVTELLAPAAHIDPPSEPDGRPTITVLLQQLDGTILHTLTGVADLAPVSGKLLDWSTTGFALPAGHAANADIVPWETEFVIERNGRTMFVGPVLGVGWATDDGKIVYPASDVRRHLTKRVIEIDAVRNGSNLLRNPEFDDGFDGWVRTGGGTSSIDGFNETSGQSAYLVGGARIKQSKYLSIPLTDYTLQGKIRVWVHPDVTGDMTILGVSALGPSNEVRAYAQASVDADTPRGEWTDISCDIEVDSDEASVTFVFEAGDLSYFLDPDTRPVYIEYCELTVTGSRELDLPHDDIGKFATETITMVGGDLNIGVDAPTLNIFARRLSGGPQLAWQAIGSATGNLAEHELVGSRSVRVLRFREQVGRDVPEEDLVLHPHHLRDGGGVVTEVANVKVLRGDTDADRMRNQLWITLGNGAWTTVSEPYTFRLDDVVSGPSEATPDEAQRWGRVQLVEGAEDLTVLTATGIPGSLLDQLRIGDRVYVLCVEPDRAVDGQCRIVAASWNPVTDLWDATLNVVPV